MKFAILTTTYQRPDLLSRAIKSVQKQPQDYLHIIVQDSPEYDYAQVEQEIQKDTRIVYIKNESNLGKNFSLNRALQYLEDSNFDGYIVFLDDDDWLSDNALLEVESALLDSTERISWLVTERSIDGSLVNKSKEGVYSYFNDYFIGKKLKGDKTHIINTQIAHGIRFSKKIKNGEEWCFFIQLPDTFLYKKLSTTESAGYDARGMTEAIKKEYARNATLLLSETKNIKMFLYLLLRIVRPFKKK